MDNSGCLRVQRGEGRMVEGKERRGGGVVEDGGRVEGWIWGTEEWLRVKNGGGGMVHNNIGWL